MSNRQCRIVHPDKADHRPKHWQSLYYTTRNLIEVDAGINARYDSYILTVAFENTYKSRLNVF